MNQVLIDGIVGGLLFAVFSYCTTIFNENPEYLKITAFLWGVPLFYFYLVYITCPKVKAMVCLQNSSYWNLFNCNSYDSNLIYNPLFNEYSYFYNILLLLIFIFVYFYFRLYNVI